MSNTYEYKMLRFSNRKIIKIIIIIKILFKSHVDITKFKFDFKKSMNFFFMKVEVFLFQISVFGDI